MWSRGSCLLFIYVADQSEVVLFVSLCTGSILMRGLDSFIQSPMAMERACVIHAVGDCKIDDSSQVRCSRYL